MRSLSGGMKRRVLVAQALVHKPPVIVLDEPTAGVDVELRQTLWKFIARLNREGHTVVLTTHYLEEAQALCNRDRDAASGGKVVALDTTAALIRRISGSQLDSAAVAARPCRTRWRRWCRIRWSRAGNRYSVPHRRIHRRRADTRALRAVRRGDRRHAAAAGRPGRCLHRDHGRQINDRLPAPCSTRKSCASGKSRPRP